jgi:predicted secreted hydrolase
MNASLSALCARSALAALLLAGQAAAQGFAGLGTGAEGFAAPRPDPVFAFPQDHGAHPAYRIEWWYLTANLTGPDGTPYGVQWTLFRSALAPREAAGWQSPQIWFAHAAATTAERHFHAERVARGGIGQAGVAPAPFRAWIDAWEMRALPGGDDALDRLSVAAAGDGFAYDLTLRAEGPLVFHGEDGYSVKSPQGQASYYYSQPFYRVEGRLSLPAGEVPVTGEAWLDREWSSQPLAETQAGWDWISLHLDSGAKLMGFRLRETDGGAFGSATWIAPDGTATPYPDGALTMTPRAETEVAGRRVPTEWRVALPARDVDLRIAALNPGAWMATGFPYWEGPVTVAGSHSGRGYLEMTGYAPD